MACTLDDDLFEHERRYVLAGLGVVDHEFLPVLYHGAEVVDRQVAASAGIVEPSAGVLLDDDRFRRHVDLGSRLSGGQHSLFFSRPATVLSARGRRAGRVATLARKAASGLALAGN